MLFRCPSVTEKIYTIAVSMASSLKLIRSSSSKDKKNEEDEKNEEDKNDVDFGSPFTEAITNTPYQYILHSPQEYNIYSDTSGLHWYLMVHCNMEGGEFPYVSLEITADKAFGSDLVPTMRALEKINTGNRREKGYGRLSDSVAADVGGIAGAALGVVGGPIGIILGYIVGRPAGVGVNAGIKGGMRGAMLTFSGSKPTKVGTMKTTIMKLCDTAETVRIGMGKYHLLTNNCQHFCNNVLEKLELPTIRTTVGHRTTDVNFDDIDEIFTLAADEKANECGGDTKG